MPSKPDELKVVVYGRNGQSVAEISSTEKGISKDVPAEVDGSPETDIAKYVNLIEAALKLGAGTYTGTVPA